MFVDKDTDAPIGHGVVVHVVLAGGADATDSALCEVTLHEQNKLVVIGDRVRKVSRYGAGDEYPGRVDLQWNDSRRVSARYKRLAWFGAAGLVNGHPLAKGEFLLDPIGALQYGVTSRLTAFTVPGLNALGMPNLGMKYLLADNARVVLTPSVIALYMPEDNLAGLQLGALASFPTNTKLISHLEVSLAVARRRAARPSADTTVFESESRATTSVRSMTEYVLDSWDRIVFGPAYDFDLQAVGGSIAYTWIWDHLHVSVGLRTANFTDIRLSYSEAYSPTVSVFWRY